MNDSDRKFRALIETINDWVWEVDEKGVYTYVSPQIEDILGYKPEEVVGKTPFDFMIPEEAKRVGEEFKKIVEEKRSFSGLENINLRKDGEEIVLETCGSPIFDKEGNFKGYRGVDRDITRRKKAENELRRKVDELERITKSMIGRELKMKELKKENAELRKKLNEN